MLLSHGGQSSDGADDLFLTAIYELKMPEVEPGSAKASEVETNYTALARGAANSVVQKVREWKVDDKLDG